MGTQLAMILSYIEGGDLIPVENLSKPYFSSFPRVWNSSDQNPKGQIRTGFLLGLSEVLTRVGTLDSRNSFGNTSKHPSIFFQDSQKSRHLSKLSTTEHLSRGITLHPDSELDVLYMFFDRLNERNVMVKSILYFDNFTKWIILVVNICPLF
jgi:hypothetical protein